MKKLLFKNAKFVKSAVAADHFPVILGKNRHPLPEIAVAGRSNVGKSSLLNDLFQTKGLVKTSSTPGKTQVINFFSLNEEVLFVDLPGYGYAKVPSSLKVQWGPMIEGYLNSRESLKGLLFLLDIRRLPNEEDIQMLRWAEAKNIPTILVLTKVDKVNASERQQQTKAILNALPYSLTYVHYSVLQKEGRNPLTSLITTCLT